MKLKKHLKMVFNSVKSTTRTDDGSTTIKVIYAKNEEKVVQG